MDVPKENATYSHSQFIARCTQLTSQPRKGTGKNHAACLSTKTSGRCVFNNNFQARGIPRFLQPDTTSGSVGAQIFATSLLPPMASIISESVLILNTLANANYLVNSIYQFYK